LRLSDAYEQVEEFDKINLELEVTVYNINEGRNAEMVNRCKTLKGYVYFVHRVRYHEAEEREKRAVPETDITRTAVKKAIQDCKDKSLLTSFWDTLKQEEANMLATEWDMATALEVEREEGFEKGLEQGLEKGLEKGREQAAQNALAEGVPVELVSKITMLDIEKVRELSYTVNTATSGR